MAHDWTKFGYGIQYIIINTRLYSVMRFSRAIIHHVEKYHFVEMFWSQNSKSYCFLAVSWIFIVFSRCAVYPIWRWFDRSSNRIWKHLMCVSRILHARSTSLFVLTASIDQSWWVCVVLCAGLMFCYCFLFSNTRECTCINIMVCIRYIFDTINKYWYFNGFCRCYWWWTINGCRMRIISRTKSGA